MRRQDEEFAAEELVLVYIAKRLKEALQLEEAFTAAELDYWVEPDKYQGGVLFRSERVGAFFYVQIFDVPRTQELLRTLGYKPYKPQESG